MNRTWKYFKVCEIISYNEFFSGSITYFSFGTRISRTRLFDGIKNLIESNIIFKQKIQSEIVYGLNIPELLKLINPILEESNLLDYTEKIKEMFENSGITTNAIVCNKEDRFMKLNKAVEEGVKKSKKAKEVKLEKIKNSGYTLTPQKIYELMKSYCKEADTPNWERLSARCKGKMRNWLKDCKEKKINPVELLEKVCFGWRLFWNSLQDDRREGIFLSGSVSFEQYYDFQKYIDVWIELHEEDLKRHIKETRNYDPNNHIEYL